MKKLRAIFKNVRPVYLLCTFVGLLFVVISLVVTVPAISENNKLDKIARTGTKATAYNLQIVDTGLTINDVHYYYLTFDYEAGLGVRDGRTSANFTYDEALRIQNDGALEIRYTYEGTVEEGFDGGKANKKYYWIIIICSLIGLAVAGFGIFKVTSTVKSAVDIKKYGLETHALSLNYKEDSEVNDIKYYRIEASYTNQRGEYVEGKTDEVYTLAQVKELVKNQNAQIRYYGNRFELIADAPQEKE